MFDLPELKLNNIKSQNKKHYASFLLHIATAQYIFITLLISKNYCITTDYVISITWCNFA